MFSALFVSLLFVLTRQPDNLFALHLQVFVTASLSVGLGMESPDIYRKPHSLVTGIAGGALSTLIVLSLWHLSGPHLLFGIAIGAYGFTVLIEQYAQNKP